MNSNVIIITVCAIVLTSKFTESFQLIPINQRRQSRLPSSSKVPDFVATRVALGKFSGVLSAKSSKDWDNDDEDDREFARVRRSSKYNQYDDEDQESDGSYYDDRKNRQKANVYDEDEDDDDDEWDDDDEEEEDYELLGDVLIPNPILDSIDPDGAADRFPELARDPKFWFDMLLFVAFLDFVSYAGPRNPFPDGPIW